MTFLPEKNLVIIKNVEFKDCGPKKWVGSHLECFFFLSILPYISEKDELLEDSRFDLELQNQFSRMTLCDIMKSAFTFTYNDTFLSYINWSNIILTLLNPKLSECLFLFIKDNIFYENIDKKEVIEGIIYAFKNKTILFLEEKSLTNLFKLLNVNSSISCPIIKETLLQTSGSFSALLKFLESELLVIESNLEKNKTK